MSTLISFDSQIWLLNRSEIFIPFPMPIVLMASSLLAGRSGMKSMIPALSTPTETVTMIASA